MSQFRVLGIDPSLNNWGMANGLYDSNSGQIDIENLELIQPVVPKGKQVRQNSKDLAAAEQLFRGTLDLVESIKPQAIFVEVPHGSQNARSMVSYGICAGVLASLRATGTPFFELTATEVKVHAIGDKKATKQQMIDWAQSKHPAAPWPHYKQNGQQVLSTAKAEHLADAIATIHAGVESQAFRQLTLLAA